MCVHDARMDYCVFKARDVHVMCKIILFLFNPFFFTIPPSFCEYVAVYLSVYQYFYHAPPIPSITLVVL